jgi:hypothetical protein
MRRLNLLTLPLLLATSACELLNPDDDGGPVTISVQQSLTGETTSAGTFVLSGEFSDEGSTTEALTFGGPLNQPVVPVTFTRTLVGVHGQITVTGSATLTFTSATAASLSGTWSVQNGTSRYAKVTGAGTLTGSANFGATPPTATLEYAGELRR